VPAPSPERFRALPASRWKRILVRLALVVIVLAAIYYAFWAFVNVRTDVLWYRSVHITDVYGTILGAQILLFCVFGILTAAAVAATLVLLIRNRPRFRPDPNRHKWRHRFLRLEHHWRVWLVVVVSVYFGVRVGTKATHRWQGYLLWRHHQSFGQQDPQFHRDLSYYVAVLPFHQWVVTMLSSIVVTCLVITAVAGYLYGAIRIRGRGRKLTPALKAQLSVLVGLYLLLKAASYWLQRYSLTTSNRFGPVTGLSYTDVHATLPGLTVLAVVAVLCALLLFANVWLGRLRWAALGIGAMVVAAFLLGSVWPSLVFRFQEQPSAARLDRPLIERNQAATDTAFGLSQKLRTVNYGGSTAGGGTQAANAASKGLQVRVLDPNKLSPTFNFKQELQAYYGFKSTLDIDLYPLDGQDQDVAIAVRELALGGIPRSSWINNHLIYTHGYGVVAAPTDQMDSGFPNFINGGLPPKNQIPVTQPRIYFGQNSPSYSVVGQPKGAAPIEFDYPSATGSSQATHTTYDGGGGIPIGSQFDRALWAVKLGDPNLFFSGDINSASQLLTVRDPRSRVAKVAPWLTLDGDVYPTVVNGRVEWVVDGYTSSAGYPYSQTTNLRKATTNSLTKSSAIVTQPNRSVNYLRNSVKAVVDAYTGQVTLYEWNQAQQPDPVLKSWESVFPGLVKPQADIPSGLVPHLRYPQDLFDVQRSLLTSYHVTNPGDFYNGSDFWKIPNDPTVAAAQTLNKAGTTGTGGSVSGAGLNPTSPSVYMSLPPTGSGASTYALSTPMVTLNYRELAGFLSVDATPGPTYGQFTLLQFPAGAGVESPSQIQNDIESDTQISKALTLQRGGNSKVVLGNLLTIPLAGKVLYVEPVYTQAQGVNSFPILRHVIAVYGNGQPAFKPTLSAALEQAIANDSH
jgi:uncharacterized membrane protein (UPF0182 family)